jgi:hypothetical protein
VTNRDDTRSAPGVFALKPLDGGHSHRLRTFRSLGDLELDSLIFFEGTKAVPLDFGMVDEHIFCVSVRGDKAETFIAVEPFHDSLCHTNFFLFPSGCNLDTPKTNFNISQPIMSQRRKMHGVLRRPQFW